jgi:uncharacterized protein YndB with AHSA1/START domain
MKRLAVIIAGLAFAACAPAAKPAETAAPPAAVEPGKITNTSYADKAGVRTIQLSAVISASQEDVFNAIATVDGWKTWAVPSAFGLAEPGAFMETSYDPAAKPGDPGNIVQEFLVVLPPRLAAFRTIKTPEGFPNAELFYKTNTILELASEGPQQTRLTLSHTGFGPGEGFDQLYNFFEQGNAQTFEQLKKRFESGPIDWSKQ